MAKRETIQKLHCNRCRHETRHRILKEVTKQGYEDVPELAGGGYSWATQYRMLECCGCEDIALQSYFNSDGPPEDTTTYPSRMVRWTPKWTWELPFEFALLLREIYRALHADSYTLATLGTRALIERVLIDRIGADKGSFKEHLAEFHKRGFVSTEGAKLLEAAIDAGHAAMHRGYQTKPSELDTVLDILESVLLNIYILPKKGHALKAKVPTKRAK